MLLKVLFLLSPFKTSPWRGHGKGFFLPKRRTCPVSGAEGSFHQAGAEQHLQGTPPGLEVGFVSGLVFLEGPLQLVNAALTEARCYERAGRAVISLPLLS